jgi:hypothetical protein
MSTRRLAATCTWLINRQTPSSNWLPILPPQQFDLVPNGKVDFEDFLEFAGSFGKPVSKPASIGWVSTDAPVLLAEAGRPLSRRGSWFT